MKRPLREMFSWGGFLKTGGNATRLTGTETSSEHFSRLTFKSAAWYNETGRK